jgi:VanZ family protein
MSLSPAHPSPRWRAVLITVLAFAFVARLTLTSARFDPEEARAGFTCIFACHSEGLRDLLSNILLFMPLGWALSHWMRPRRALGLCLLATIAIETLQATVLTGRDSSLRDILSNTAGGAIGIWLFGSWRSLLWPDTRVSRALGLLATAVWAVVLTCSAYGTGLAPSTRTWFGLWTTQYGEYAQYPGKLLSLDVNGATPPHGEMPEPIPLRGAMNQNSFLLRAKVISGPEPRRTAPIFSIVDRNHDEQLVVGQDRYALLLQVRTRFEQWEFRPLIARLAMFPGRAEGDTVNIEAGKEAGDLVLRASTATEHAEVKLPLTAGWGWAAMLPFRYPVQVEWLLLNPLWLAGLILPVGYWFGRAGPVAGLVATMAVLAVGLLAAPLVAGSAPTVGVEWIGALGGAALGWGAGTRSRGRGRARVEGT